jgi:dihydropteroate synthase
VSRDEVIRALFDAFNRADVETLIRHLDEDVEIVPLRAALEDVSYHGHAGAAEFMADTRAIWNPVRVDLEEARPIADGVLVLGRLSGNSADGGVPVELAAAWHVKFRGARATLIKTYADRAAAIAELTGPGEDATPPFRVMGVVNVTPDSFSDGGRFFDADAAVDHALDLAAQGADILDFGGESTRPGSEGVSVDEEMRRVIPVIERVAAADLGVQISIDTSKLAVAQAAVEAGASLVNDVTALRGDPELPAFVAEKQLDCCLMHMLGEPRTMQVDPRYDDVVDDVRAFLAERVEAATGAGIAAERLLVDPGIGFGKTVDHNLELLRRLDELVALGPPVVIGTSRKSFLGRITGRGEDDRLPGTIATNVLALERGARVFRVHDVGPVRDALEVAAGTVTGRWTPKTTTSITTS